MYANCSRNIWSFLEDISLIVFPIFMESKTWSASTMSHLRHTSGTWLIIFCLYVLASCKQIY